MGPVLGFAPLGCDPGVGHTRADGARARGARTRDAQGNGPRRSFFLVLLCRDCDREVGLPEGGGLPAEIASTNLVFELGRVLWIFLGPAFTAAEVGGGFP